MQEIRNDFVPYSRGFPQIRVPESLQVSLNLAGAHADGRWSQEKWPMLPIPHFPPLSSQNHD